MDQIAQGLEYIAELVAERLGDIWSYPFLVGPTDPLYGPYLLIYLGVGVALYLWVSARAGGVFSDPLAFLFPRDVYQTRSAWTDLKLYLFNRVFGKLLSLGLVLSAAIWVGTSLSGILAGLIGEVGEIHDPGRRRLVEFGYTLSIFVASNFAFYVNHFALHKIPLLWEFHKTHHAAEGLTPLTNHRFHPVEVVLNSCIQGPIIGFVSGLFHFFFSGSIGHSEFLVLTAANISVFAALRSVADSLYHSHFWIDFGPRWSHIFMSPAQHHIHHSIKPEHHDTNLGALLSVWDWMFGTLYVPKGHEALEYGLPDNEHLGFQSVRGSLVVPLLAAWKRLRGKAVPGAGPTGPAR